MEKIPQQKFDYIVVLDFEATCDEKKNFGPQEIIEFPSVIIDTRTFQVVSEIQLYIKPVAQPQLTKFCTELTGITQDKVNGGESFLPSFEKYQGWLKKNELFDKKWTFLTCGDWDLLRMLPAQTKLSGIRIPKEFKSWINIKKVFSSFYNKNAAGMAGMLNILGMKLEGRHHSGIDDCKNIARIAIQMMKDGVNFDYTQFPTAEAGGNSAPVSNLPWVQAGKGQFCLLPRPNKKKIGELKMEGCEVLVTMMTDAEGANVFKQGCELSMLEWVHLPMPAKSLPSPMDKDFFKTRVAELAKMLNDGQKIVFHCDDGITRSAVIVYAVLRSLGHEPTKAEELIVKARAPATKGLTFTARQWADEVAGVSK